MSETIDFKFNKPEIITLAFAEGRKVPSKFPGSVRTMRTTKDSRVFFCDPHLEAKIAALNPAPGVQIEITKTERENSRKGFDWKVTRVGRLDDGTYKISKADSSTPTVSAPASVLPTPTSSGTSSIDSPQAITAIPSRPVTEAEQHCFRLVELMAKTMEHAQKSGAGFVTREDARAIALTIYIQLGKSGRLKWRSATRTRRAG